MIIHRNLGLAYLEENKPREAAEFQTLIELAPREPLGYANPGLTYLRMGQIESAEKWLQEAVKQAPDHPDIALLLAKAYEAAGREREALRALEISLKKNSPHVRTLYQLAQYYLNTPAPEAQKKAEENLTPVVNALPGNVAAYLEKEKNSRQYLFANDHGVFADMAAQAGLAHAGRDFSARFADYDNDGFLDLFITNARANKLYRNTGAGLFREVTAASGIRTNATGQTVFADLDHDGDLDLLIAAGAQNLFYRNNSDGTFVEMAAEAGLSGEKGMSRAVGFGDFNDDGDMDIFMINQNGSTRYYDNLRQGYFRDITEHTGLATAGGSGAIAVGDYNNDGNLDFLVTDLTGKPPSLFRNRGGVFEKDTRSDSAFASSRRMAGLDAAFFDADNDGFLDLLIAGAAMDSLAKPGAVRLFYNDGEGKYWEASSLLPPLPEGGRQVEVTDYDNDGDMDIFLAGARDNLQLLRNDGGDMNNYLVVRLAGLRTGSGKNNYFGIGSKVEVKAGDLNQVRLMNEPIAHFGLGSRERAELVRVVWSNGVAQNWLNPERNQTIVESQILKGSCPWLYAWNGERYEFVTDVLWTSALGMPLGIMGKEMGYAFANSRTIIVFGFAPTCKFTVIIFFMPPT